MAPSFPPSPVPTICTNVTAQNAGYTNYDDNVMVSLYCESRDLTYKELGYAFLAVLIIVICMMYCFYRFLKMIIDF